MIVLSVISEFLYAAFNTDWNLLISITFKRRGTLASLKSLVTGPESTKALKGNMAKKSTVNCPYNI